MSRSERLWVISYDISDNKRRRRVARKLEEVMTRVQFSVFEGRLSVRRTERLLEELRSDLAKDDSLRVYSIGSAGERHCRVLGNSPPIESNSGYWLL